MIQRRQHRRVFEHAGSVEQRHLRAAAVLFGAHAFYLGGDTGLIGFQHLAAAFVDLYAIAIERNVAAGHHHAGAFIGNSPRD